MKQLALTIVSLLLLAGTNSYAQYADYTLTDQSTLTITGTSTLHDWECAVEDFSVDSKISTSSAKPLIDSFKLSAVVESIECGKGAMNRKTRGALNEDDHPVITFSVTSADIKKTDEGNQNDENNQTFDVGVEGDLTIAGVTRSVSFPATGQLGDNKEYQFSGSYKLNMEDYEVDPPKAMLGTIRAGEEVEIDFSITMAPDQQVSN